MSRGKRRHVVGVVTSNRMQKSVVVEVTRLVKHPLYGKYLRRRTKFMAHDEENAAGIGDRVELVETRPISKRKSWRLLRVLQKAAMVEPVLTVEDLTARADEKKKGAGRPAGEVPHVETPAGDE